MDRGELARLTKLTQQALNQTDITVMADKGYYSRKNVKASLDLGANPHMPKTDTSASSKKAFSISLALNMTLKRVCIFVLLVKKCKTVCKYLKVDCT